jgi:hypothetical protein
MSVLGWPVEQAWEWYRGQPWLVGCNYIPSTAINQLEMWQADTFDPDTIGRELDWAANRLGFNTVRVFLHDLLWEDDSNGLITRVDQFLDICQKLRIRPLFVFFDDCWNPNPALGRQPVPKPGVHNSGWVQSPGKSVKKNPAQWGRLETYVTGFLKTFGRDPRILAWDLYNEPGNSHLGVKSLPLLQAAFSWARAAEPSQPVTAGVWLSSPTLLIPRLASWWRTRHLVDDWSFDEPQVENPQISEFSLNASDIICFHNYRATDVQLRAHIARLKARGRPVICTEYMARRKTAGSPFARYLPIFKEEGVGAYSWGLVSGKTQTIFPWRSLPIRLGNEPQPKEPSLWFHDIFHPDGRPYDPAEVELICSLTKRQAA